MGKLIQFNRFEDVNSQVGVTPLVNNGGVTFTSGYHGNAATFAGAGKLTNNSFQMPNYFTVQFWIRVDSTTNAFRRWFVLDGAGAYADWIMLRETNGGLLQWYVGTSNGTAALTKGAWFHCAATYDGVYFRVFTNGALVATQAFSPITWRPILYLGGTAGGSEMFIGQIDTLKIYDYAKTDFSDRFYEFDSVDTTAPLPKIWFMGKDLYELGYVDKMQPVIEQKTWNKDKLIENDYSQNVYNFDDAFSEDNVVSLIKNTYWRYSPFSVYNSLGDIVFDGVATDISCDHNNKTAVITAQSSMAKLMNQTISYTSTTWETAADAAKNIMDNYSFTQYDAATINKSIATLTAASCYVKVRFNADDKISFKDAIEKLAEYACANCYLSKNKVYFRHTRNTTGAIKINVTEDQILQSPTTRTLLTEMINEYDIDYNGSNGVPATDAANGNIASISRTRYGTHSLAKMTGGGADQIIIKDLTSAVYIGESYIYRTHINLLTQPRPKKEIKFSIMARENLWLSLATDTYFYLTFSDESWVSKAFEIYTYEMDEDNNEIRLTAVEI